jgi:hypothetical protein
VPHPFGYKKKNDLRPSTYSSQLSETHLDLLSKLTNKERGPLSRTRTLLARIPRVARADREACAVRRERQRGDGSVVARVLAQPLFDLVVPDGDGGVRAPRRERIVRRVEGERIDRPNVIDVVDRLAVALERVLFFLDGRRGVEVLYGNAALDGGRRVP